MVLHEFHPVYLESSVELSPSTPSAEEALIDGYTRRKEDGVFRKSRRIPIVSPPGEEGQQGWAWQG